MSVVKAIGLFALLAILPRPGYAATVTVWCNDLLLPYSGESRTGTLDVYVRVQGDGAPDVWGQSVRLELLDTGGGLELSTVARRLRPGRTRIFYPTATFRAKSPAEPSSTGSTILRPVRCR